MQRLYIIQIIQILLRTYTHSFATVEKTSLQVADGYQQKTRWLSRHGGGGKET